MLNIEFLPLLLFILLCDNNIVNIDLIKEKTARQRKNEFFQPFKKNIFYHFFSGLHRLDQDVSGGGVVQVSADPAHLLRIDLHPRDGQRPTSLENGSDGASEKTRTTG